MSNKMLIDASHPEETRVVVTRGNRIEEFDFESEAKKQLKGNIYLARVTRVEPSLQAAFVEYGGNRHGFLAFSEIHPDYYQIPVADRQAILAAEAAEADADEDDDDTEKPEPTKRKRRRGGRGRGRATTKAAKADSSSEDGETDDSGEVKAKDLAPEANEASADQQAANTDEVAKPEDTSVNNAETVDNVDGEPAATPEPDDAKPTDEPDKESGGPAKAASIHADVISEDIPEEVRDQDTEAEEAEQPVAEETEAAKEKPKKRTRRSTRSKKAKEPEPSDDNGENGDDGEQVESVGAEDALEELPSRRRPVRRQYKIQEVIKRRQILLVQVVKEERGNKGAALTTYLSLAGRYSVLMPNTARGGGISRKITNVQDRKRLKDVVKELDVPQGMGVILRTAGANRTKAEIKRDYEYLMRLWMTIRNLTLESTAPALVHEEGSLIKRSVRDLYNKDIGEILVAGDDGYREAKDFMRMLMPSHAKAVQPYKEVAPIFARNGIEAQLDRMLQPQVTLKSGGYIIINQTEALVAIDVNSGRSTREHSIEDTALQTNLEAAEEVARQLRLRDLAGLIVIDFIDMEEKRNNRSVEKRLKECLKHDRARIQVGRISHFGLLEMSRQRIRASVLESTMKPCEVCHGTGHIRSESSVALHVVRGIEEHLLKDSGHDIAVKTPAATALYVLNNKRANLSELEERFGLTISIEADETLGTQHFQIVKGAPAEQPAQITGEPDTSTDEETEADATQEDRPPESGDDGGNKKRRRRRRRKSGRGGDNDAVSDNDTAADSQDAHADGGADAESNQQDETGEPKKRRRGRRGGKRNRQNDGAPNNEAPEAEPTAEEASAATQVSELEVQSPEPAADAVEQVEDKPKPRRGRRKASAAENTGADAVQADAEPVDAAAGNKNAEDQPDPAGANNKPPRRARRKSAAADNSVTKEPAEPVVTSVIAEESNGSGEPEQPTRQGWWKRKGFF